MREKGTHETINEPVTKIANDQKTRKNHAISKTLTWIYKVLSVC